MYNLTAQREMEIIRYKFRTNSRLNLEFRSALSKLFRDYRQPVDDEILSQVSCVQRNKSSVVSAEMSQTVAVIIHPQQNFNHNCRRDGNGSMKNPLTNIPQRLMAASLMDRAQYFQYKQKK